MYNLNIVLKACPWCKKPPLIDISIQKGLSISDRWSCAIYCDNKECVMSPRSFHVSLKDHNPSVEKLIDRVLNIAEKWNTGNESQNCEFKILDLDDIFKRFVRDDP